MRKGKGLFKKLLAVTALAGTAAVLITKLKKNSCGEGAQNGSGEDDFCEGADPADRNYVPLSHGEEEVAGEEAVPEETVSEEAASAPETAEAEETPSAEEIAAKLEQAVAETEARYEEAAKDGLPRRISIVLQQIQTVTLQFFSHLSGYLLSQDNSFCRRFIRKFKKVKGMLFRQYQSMTLSYRRQIQNHTKLFILIDSF